MAGTNITERGDEPTKEQQFKIFSAADVAWNMLAAELPPEECVAAIATMLSFHVGESLLSNEARDDMLKYIAATVTELSPHVREAVQKAAQKGAH